MPDLPSWKDLRAEFQQHAEQYAPPDQKMIGPTPLRRWSLVTGAADPQNEKYMCERFGQIVREALAELGCKYHDPPGAIEAWLDFLLKESVYSRGMAIAELGTASRHELAELKVRALESANQQLATTLGRLEGQCEFPKSFHAILRVDVCRLPEDIRLRAVSIQAPETSWEVPAPENEEGVAIRDAVKLFERQPGFPEAQVWMRDRMSKLPMSGGMDLRERAKIALSYYNIRAATFHRLISNVETQNAFMVLLDHFGDVAWYEFIGTGTPIEIREGAPSIAPGITKRKKWWTRKGYKRVADLVGSRRTCEEVTSAPAALKPDLTITSTSPAIAHDLTIVEHPLALTPANVRDPDKGERLFHRVGDSWELRFLGKRVHIRDSKGMRYIAELVRCPGQDLHVWQLLAAIEGQAAEVRPGSAGNILDETAIRQYKARGEELTADLAEAKRNNDWGRKEAIEQELDQIAEELASATGLGGRDRRAKDDVERARKSVYIVIKRAIKAIREHHHELADHLDLSIKSGVSCCYRGGMDWQL